MDNEYRMQYAEKMLRAAVMAMDEDSHAASEYLLQEIPWAALSVEEIFRLIKIARTQEKTVFQGITCVEVR